MRFETIRGLRLPKIGFGTWRIGGNSYPDPGTDSISLTALHTALEVGYTHFDTAETYANGHAEELVGLAVRQSGVERESLFITSKVQPSHLAFDQVLRACKASLDRLQMDYLDLYLIHWPGLRTDYKQTFRALNQLVREGRVRHIGVSNFGMKLLKQAQDLSETPLLTNQLPYSLSERSYVRNGAIPYCQKNSILSTAYSPFDEGRLKEDPVLRSVAEAHGATIFQVALAWLVTQPGVITIPMSHNPRHIRENFEAAEIGLSEKEMSKLSNPGGGGG